MSTTLRRSRRIEEMKVRKAAEREELLAKLRDAQNVNASRRQKLVKLVKTTRKAAKSVKRTRATKSAVLRQLAGGEPFHGLDEALEDLSSKSLVDLLQTLKKWTGYVAQVLEAAEVMAVAQQVVNESQRGEEEEAMEGDGNAEYDHQNGIDDGPVEAVRNEEGEEVIADEMNDAFYSSQTADVFDEPMDFGHNEGGEADSAEEMVDEVEGDAEGRSGRRYAYFAGQRFSISSTVDLTDRDDPRYWETNFYENRTMPTMPEVQDIPLPTTPWPGQLSTAQSISPDVPSTQADTPTLENDGFSKCEFIIYNIDACQDSTKAALMRTLTLLGFQFDESEVKLGNNPVQNSFQVSKASRVTFRLRGNALAMMNGFLEAANFHEMLYKRNKEAFGARYDEQAVFLGKNMTTRGFIRAALLREISIAFTNDGKPTTFSSTHVFGAQGIAESADWTLLEVKAIWPGMFEKAAQKFTKRGKRIIRQIIMNKEERSWQ